MMRDTAVNLSVHSSPIYPAPFGSLSHYIIEVLPGDSMVIKDIYMFLC
jgi:hypothetical protein